MFTDGAFVSRRHRLLLLALLVALAVTGGQALPPLARAAVTQQPPGEGLTAEHDEVLSQEAGLITELQNLIAQREQLQTDIAELEAQRAATEADLANAEAELTDVDAAGRAAEADLADAQRRLDEAAVAMERQVVASYVTGGDGGVTAHVLDLEDPVAAGSGRAYAAAINRHQRGVIAEHQAARQARDDAVQSSREARDQARARRDEIAAARQSIDLTIAQTAALVAEVDEQGTAELTLLNELQGRRAEIEARIVSQQQTADGIGQLLASLQVGQLQWRPGSMVLGYPLPGFPIGSEFGPRHHPILNYSRLHAGADIGAPTGTPIQSVGVGRVVVAQPRGGYGNTVVIDHGNGLGTVYAHQSQILVRPGEVVQGGQVIGRVGSTGLSTGPHLHFETRLRGVPVDPRTILPTA